MKQTIKVAIGIMLCAIVFGWLYAVDVQKVESEDARFHALLSELRCMVCQNESLAESTAPLAIDLRQHILDMMDTGASDAMIKTELTSRYGEYILYRPVFENHTYVLWLLPLVLLAGAGLTLMIFVVKRK